MTTTTAELVSYQDPVELAEHVAIAGFLAGYGGNTHTSYTTDLRIYTEWFHANGLGLLGVRRERVLMPGVMARSSVGIGRGHDDDSLDLPGRLRRGTTVTAPRVRGGVTGFLVLVAIPVGLIGFCAWRVSRRQARASSMTPAHDHWRVERDARLSSQRSHFTDPGGFHGFSGDGGGAGS